MQTHTCEGEGEGKGQPAILFKRPHPNALYNCSCAVLLLVSQDSVWGMNHSTLHSVFQTNQSNNQQSSFEAVQSGKKKKKQKMVRADPSLLGENRPGVSAWMGGRFGRYEGPDNHKSLSFMSRFILLTGLKRSG